MTDTGFYFFQFFSVVAAETFVLWRLSWGSLKESLLDSLMINFVSFLGLALELAPRITSHGPFGLLLFFTYCIIVEVPVLFLLERGTPTKIIKGALIANASSTVLLGILAVLHKT